MAEISEKDKSKPLLLIAAIAAGILIQRAVGEIPSLIYLTEIGVFFLITAVMLPVEIREISQAFKRIKPTAIALLINFVFIPGFSWIMGFLILKNYPDLWAGAILYTLTPCIGWYLIFIDIAKGNLPWGISLLPWNIILQVALMPLYLYILVGKVISLDITTTIRSIILFLLAPFVLSQLIQRIIINHKGREYFLGSFKSAISEIKMWALILVIVSMFASQRINNVLDLYQITLLIIFLFLFFFVLFLLVVLISRVFNLTYEDTVTMAFTTTARNSEAVIGIALSVFPGQPLLYFAIIMGPIVELPALLLMARIMLDLKEKGFVKYHKMQEGGVLL